MMLKNINLYRMDLSESNIENLRLDNVTVRGKLNYEDAKVKNYEAKNVTVNEGVEIESNGANIKIETTK